MSESGPAWTVNRHDVRHGRDRVFAVVMMFCSPPLSPYRAQIMLSFMAVPRGVEVRAGQIRAVSVDEWNKLNCARLGRSLGTARGLCGLMKEDHKFTMS